MTKKIISLKIIGATLFGIILVGFLAYLSYSNIITYTSRFASISGNFVLQDSCEDYHLSDEFLRELRPQTMAEFNIFCSIKGGNIWEDSSSVICVFPELKDNTEFCTSELASKLETQCDFLGANWGCLKKEISCRCE